MCCIIILPRYQLQNLSSSHDFSWTLNPNMSPVYLSLFLVSLFHQTYSEELIVLQGGLSLTDRFRFSRFKTRIEWVRLTESVCLSYLHFTCVKRDSCASLSVWATHLLFINVSHSDTVLLSPDASECTFCCRFIKTWTEKEATAVFLWVFHPFHSACFIYYKSRDGVCPYFFFQHHHLVCLYCPNFF